MGNPKFSRSRRAAIAGGAAVLLGGTVAVTAATAARASQSVGISIATEAVGMAAPDEDVLFISAEGGEPTILKEHREKWLKAVADKLGVTSERLEQALTDVAKEQGMPVPLMPFPPFAIGKPGAEVRWAVAGRMVVAWLITLPAAAIVGALAYWLSSGVKSVTGSDLAGDGLIFLILCALSFYMWWRAQQQKVDHNNVNADWDDSTNSVVPADVREAAKAPKDTATV